MKNTHGIQWYHILLSFALFWALAACGGGVDDATPTAADETAVPAPTETAMPEATAEPVEEVEEAVDHTGQVKVLTYNADGERTAVEGLDGMDDYFTNAIIGDDFTITTDTGVFQLPEEIVKVCVGEIPASSLTCMDRPTNVTSYEVTDEMLTPQPSDTVECPEGYDDCVAIATVIVPAGSPDYVTGATLFIADANGNMIESGFVEKDQPIPLYWKDQQEPSYYAVWTPVGPRWISAEYITDIKLAGESTEIHAAINTSDWTEGQGGGSPEVEVHPGGGAPPVLFTSEEITDEGWKVTVTATGDLTGLYVGLEDHVIGLAAEVLPLTITDGYTTPDGFVVEIGKSMAPKLYPTDSFAEGEFATLDAEGLIIHGPDFYVQP